jgi:hypothetical protein
MVLAADHPLPSWNARIIAFVEGVSSEGGEDYIALADRIAVFDYDGMLWSEQPIYVLLAFAIHRVKFVARSNRNGGRRSP